MKNKLLAVTGILILASCNLPKMATKSIFNNGDSNRDGYLSFEEFWEYRKYDSVSEKELKDKGVSSNEELVKKDFEEIDANRDNKLSKDETRNYFMRELKKG